MNAPRRLRLSRRRFLSGVACGLGICATRRLAPDLLAAVSRVSGPRNREPRALVIVQLQGGNDSLNTVVPFHDDAYYRLRPTLAVARRDLVPLGENLALNKAARAMEPLFKEGKLAIVPCAGGAPMGLSHFRSTEIWHTASAANEMIYSGWIGRCGAHLRAGEIPVAAFHTGKFCPRIFMGEKDRIGQPPARAFPISSVVNLGEVGEEVGRSGATEIYFVSVPGFDTHSRQKEIHAERLHTVTSALAGMQRRIEQRGVDRRVVTLVFSEFGRGAAENSQGGTDHGDAGLAFLLGTPVEGGLCSQAETDFRRIVNTLVTRWLEVPSQAVFSSNPGTVDDLLRRGAT